MNRTFTIKMAVLAGLMSAAVAAHYLLAPSIYSPQDQGSGHAIIANAHHNTHCEIKQPDREYVSWGAWIAGKSGSYQVHFLDLLELLTRNERSAIR